MLWGLFCILSLTDIVGNSLDISPDMGNVLFSKVVLKINFFFIFFFGMKLLKFNFHKNLHGKLF